MIKEEILEKVKQKQAIGKDGLWVQLESTLKICIIGYSEEQQLFIGKFFPCAKNSKAYQVKLSDIEEILDTYRD